MLDQHMLLDSEGPLKTNAIAQDAAQWRAQLYESVGVATDSVLQIKAHQIAQFGEMTLKITRSLDAKLRLLVCTPARQATGNTTTQRRTAIRPGNSDEGQDSSPATLCSRPKLLTVVWDEWQNGIGGRKPACLLFTRAEHGQCKQVYSH